MERRALMIRAFLQARMSSRRFPGKVLAPLGNRPIIAHLIGRVTEVLPLTHVSVLTSTDSSDDPLACYVQNLGVSVYRGELDNVTARFQACLREYPCSWFFRLCGDSPLLDSRLLQTFLPHSECTDLDLVTNVYPRTFPKGHSVELLKAETFATLDPSAFSTEEQEHVTKVFYNHPHAFRILNVASADPRQAELSFVIDTVADLRRLASTLETSGGPGEGRE
jgi:spore coat polysaccharide biosynthesis protein SpsF